MVEDDDTLGEILRDFFRENNLNVTWAKDGKSAINLLKKMSFSLILLDVVLPDISGFEIAKEIRKSNSILPVIFMTGSALNVKDYEQAFRELGAINYIEKPFIPAKAVAQIKSVLQPLNTLNYITDSFQVSITGQQLKINNKAFTLLEKEAVLFSILLKNKNSTVSRNCLLAKIWKDDNKSMNNALDRTISSLRKTFKDYMDIDIITIYGNGYELRIN